MGKVKDIWAAYHCTIRPAEKRAETMAARKADQGCACHGVDLVKCPDYKPEVWAGFRRGTAAYKWAV